MFSIDNATGGYKKTRIIENVSISVKEGEIVGLLGRNGVGKTTLLKYAMGLIDNFGGSVSIEGKTLPLSTSKRVKMGLGYVPQGRFVFPRLSTLENISAAAIACGHNPKIAIDEALNDFPSLKLKINDLAGNLSGGQQQILSIARALATKPKVLILDEPTEGIQPTIINEIGNILKSLNINKKISIIIAEQNLDFCLNLVQRAYIMNGGRIVKESTKEKIIENKELLHELLAV